MKREGRAARLVDEIAGQLASAHRVRLPLVSDDDAVAISRQLHAEIADGCAERARAVAARGEVIACARGCNACCANVIFVYEPEAVEVAEWLARPEQREARAAFLAAYPAWHAETGASAAAIRDLHGRGAFDEAQRAYEELRARAILCAFNVDGACAIYPVRPNVCRNTHALGTAERCAPGSAERPRFLEHAPLEATLDRARRVLRAVQQRRLGTTAAGALCDVVHERLTAPPPEEEEAPVAEPGRNDPCPCGSGRKYKRCHGA
jgi:hypothetical protein